MSTQCVVVRTDKVNDKSRQLECGANAVSAKTRKSLKYYKCEAAAQGDEAATSYCGASYVAAYGGAEGLGLLGSMIHLFSGLLYMKLPAAAEALGSRKRAVLAIGLVDALTWLPLIFVFLFVKSLPLVLFIALWVVSVVPSIIITPVLFSWVSDMIPVNRRGRYFGMRSIIAGAAYLGLFYAMGHLLNIFDGRVSVGFAIIFFIAFISQMTSWTIYQRMYEPPAVLKKDECFGLLDFLKALKHSNLGKFIIYVSLLNFTIYLALPFLSVFILEDLQFSYAFFTILMLSQMVGKLLSLGFWGKFSDQKGNLQVIAIVSILAPVVPILWLISQDVIYLIFAMLFSGVVWSGLELCAPNFVYEAAPAGRGMKYVSYYRGFSSIAMAIGMLLGGYLATHMSPLMDYRVLSLFLVSGLLSLIVVIALLPRLSEVRPLAHWKPKTPGAKWRLSSKPRRKQTSVPSLNYQPMLAAAGYGQLQTSLSAAGGGVKPVKGLFYQSQQRTYWGKPLVPRKQGDVTDLGSPDCAMHGRTYFGKPLVPHSPYRKANIAKQGLLYRPQDWAYYWCKTSSTEPGLGLGADAI